MSSKKAWNRSPRAEVKLLGSNAKMVMAWEDDGVFRNLTIAYPMFQNTPKEEIFATQKAAIGARIAGVICGTENAGGISSSPLEMPPDTNLRQVNKQTF